MRREMERGAEAVTSPLTLCINSTETEIFVPSLTVVDKCSKRISLNVVDSC